MATLLLAGYHNSSGAHDYGHVMTGGLSDPQNEGINVGKSHHATQSVYTLVAQINIGVAEGLC
ncbi:MAG TPA: hypothetical protein VFA40_08310 [Terriglobales bacterium]|nr:hypothetical protein [Terriglobales bacterium]